MDIIYNSPWLLSESAAREYLQVYEDYLETKGQVKQSMAISDEWETRVIGDTAIIPVTGVIMRYANNINTLCGIPTSTGLLHQAVKQYAEDKSISRIVLDIDSPGGDARGISELAATIKSVTNIKPVIAYASGQCASAAYWIASACTKIYASNTALIGSIGAVAGYRKDKDKNVEEIVSSQSPNKRLDVDNKDDRAIIQQNIDDLAGVFISTVASYRGMTDEEVIKAGNKGAVLIASKALENKLIDGISSMDTILSEKDKENIMAETKDDKNVQLTAEEIAALKGSIPEETYERLVSAINATETQNKLIAEQYAELVAKNKELEAKQKELVKQSFIAKAEKEFPHLTGTSEEKGEILMKIDTLDEQSKNYIMGIMAVANEKTGEAMKPISTPETKTEAVDTYKVAFEEKTKELMEKHNLTYTEAKCKAHEMLGEMNIGGEDGLE